MFSLFFVVKSRICLFSLVFSLLFPILQAPPTPPKKKKKMIAKPQPKQTPNHCELSHANPQQTYPLTTSSQFPTQNHHPCRFPPSYISDKIHHAHPPSLNPNHREPTNIPHNHQFPISNPKPSPLPISQIHHDPSSHCP